MLWAAGVFDFDQQNKDKKLKNGGRRCECRTSAIYMSNKRTQFNKNTNRENELFLVSDLFCFSLICGSQTGNNCNLMNIVVGLIQLSETVTRTNSLLLQYLIPR